MNEWLLAHLKDMKTSFAWTLFLGFGAALVFNRFGIWPFEHLDSGFTQTLLGIISFVGLARLIVGSGQWVLEKNETHRAKKSEEAERIRKQAEELEHVKKNLKTLTPNEKAQLFWILRRDHSRVDQPVEYSLISKQLLKPVSRASDHLVDVHPWVWQNRLEIIGTDTRTGMVVEFPFVKKWV